MHCSLVKKENDLKASIAIGNQPVKKYCIEHARMICLSKNASRQTNLTNA